MKSFSAVLSAIFLTVFIFTANAQTSSHAAHHPQQSQATEADTSQGVGMMPGGGMMSGMMGNQGMMQGNMMANMMRMMHGEGMMEHHGPMQHVMHLVYHLPEMKSKLELTGDQTTQLKSIQANFLKEKADWDAKIEKQEIDLGLQLDKKAPAAEVQKSLKSIYDVKLDMKVASYKTAQKMRDVLSPEQQQKLENVCPMCSGQGMMGGMMQGMMQ